MIKENQRIFTTLLKCVDLVIVVIAMLLAYEFRFSLLHGVSQSFGLRQYLRMVLIAAPVYFLLYHGFELYDIFHYKSLPLELWKITTVNLFGMAFLFLLSFFMRQIDTSRLVIVLCFLFSTMLAGGIRVAVRIYLRHVRRRGSYVARVVIVGWNDISGEYFDKIMQNSAMGYRVIGFLSDRRVQTGRRAVECLGRLDQLAELLQNQQADEVIISLDQDDFSRLGSIIEVCETQGVKASLLPFYLKYLPANPYIDELDGMPLINLHRIPLDNLLNCFLKRSMDLMGALILLVLLSPLLGMTALAVCLSSPGPVIYRQQRIGRNQREFTMYKFRSMKMEGNADATQWGTRCDNRRTGFGVFARKFSLDELPQLYNVLRGDMSLVGPRPERPFFVEKFRDEVPLYMLKHLVRPGITGWAQVNGWRGDTSIVERVKCDLFYIENWSLAFDLKILMLTLVRGIINPAEEL
ncbi:MAG: undecaprenyl-phosphate glucose phosphotransferase [Oscillospiraceae bacterium]